MTSASEPRFRFVHLTDTHIMAGATWRPRAGNFEFDTEASLRRVVDAVRALDPAPEFAVLGGDLASPDLIDRERSLTPEAYEPSYRLLREILAGLPCPAHFLVGNHDNRVAFHRVLKTEAAAPDAPPSLGLFSCWQGWPPCTRWPGDSPAPPRGDAGDAVTLGPNAVGFHDVFGNRRPDGEGEAAFSSRVYRSAWYTLLTAVPCLDVEPSPLVHDREGLARQMDELLRPDRG